MNQAALSPEESAQLRLLTLLESHDYDFVPVTPETHRRFVEKRASAWPTDMRAVFGWSLPFREEALGPELKATMKAAALLVPDPDGWKSTARISRVRGRLFLHSAFPTEDDDSVFLGPDSLRFVDFILDELNDRNGFDRLVDIGAGAGVGGITVATQAKAGEVVLADVNVGALSFARVNAAYAGVAVEIVESDGLDSVSGSFDVAIANPPFIFEENAPIYRRGGGMHGAELSRNWAMAAARKVAPGGCVLLYTGSAIVDGIDALRQSLEQSLPSLGCSLAWREIDPDIFGEELEKPAYREVERIAAIGAVIRKSSSAQT